MGTAEQAPTKILYTAVATADGGRDGHVRTDDGALDVDVRVPEAMGGQGGGTNPEQLFASGYAACFQSALFVVARRARADVTGSTVTAAVGIGPNGGGGYGLTVELTISLPSVDSATARELAEAAHQVCPYSNATRGNIEVRLTTA
ncbi:organic hydroperoxide resistance protein [Prauserella marina]|uniref:Peroxiredoxin, Ohr subfamily n=1 Tax=Prauserella marina TaxID=530584 RepID=A0A222VQY1_9PSEU|nr:organic hydroperoxide resistance protein [Prauserella marina]ASR36345.1 organic hydroperoxide resistance protein [Prauserella marina]PWV77135.1 Ohr subfamily peroxiredoxin [Prauserella marina]SDD05246.1 peroxiredoxin, Ohr subfamily [Prauserella marina]